MGSCLNTILPEEDAEVSDSQSLKPFTSNGRKLVEFGREEAKLNELLASLRTGLVFAPTEFSVLPGGLGTTAKVTFDIGNSELQRRQEATLEEESLHDHHLEGSGAESDSVTDDTQPFKLKVTLEGHGWANHLVMTLGIQPVVGPFSSRTLQFLWRDNVLEVLGCEQGELEAHSLPLSFESEVDFCKCCLQLVYHNKKRVAREPVDEDTEQDITTSCDASSDVPSLRYCAYRRAVANLDVISNKHYSIPAKLYHIFFGSQDPINISINFWPKTNETGTTSLTMTIKSGILFAELVYLIKERLCCSSECSLKLYHNYMPLHTSDAVSSEFKHLDCFMLSRDNAETITGSCASLEGSFISDAELIVSLVGMKIQTIEADLEMSMEKFDALVRGQFMLKNDTFLVILSEDDFAPQYMADDNWKCTYPFSIPDNSFGAGLRRSIRRLSTRRRGGDGARSHSTTPGSSSVFAPLMAEVIELLSSNERRFPRNDGRCGLSIEELYKSMPMYTMSIEQCGIHPYSVIQVFEVTGPSIPITVRVVSDYCTDDTAPQRGTSGLQLRTRLANIMDINPNWSISTFLQYIDAVISLSSSSRQKRLCLKDNSVDDKDNLSGTTLGALLDSWKPLWWAEKGCTRKHLTTKDIDPSEYLVVEMF